MSRVHNVKSCMRRYIIGTHCLVCLRECHSRELLLNHVRYRSNVCKNNSLLRGPVLTQCEADALDEECKGLNRTLYASGKRRHHVDASSYYLQGPLLPILVEAARYSRHHPLGIGHRYI